MSDKEVIDAMLAVNKMLAALKDSSAKLSEVLKVMDKAAEGDVASWFKGVETITEMDQDDLIGCLIVATQVLSKLRVKARGTPMYDEIREILGVKADA